MPCLRNPAGALQGARTLPRCSRSAESSGSRRSLHHASASPSRSRTATATDSGNSGHSGDNNGSEDSKDEDEQCQYREWLDEEWPERVQASLKEMWKEVKLTRRCEANANEALHEAIVSNETANNARIALQAEVTGTKALAEKICHTYQRKTAYAVVDKCKLMYILYCLLGVVVILLLVVLFKVK